MKKAKAKPRVEVKQTNGDENDDGIPEREKRVISRLENLVDHMETVEKNVKLANEEKPVEV